MKIEDIEGVGPAFAAKLKAAGVDTTEELLKTGASARQRDGLAASTGISSAKILEWVNHADLMRIKGVGSEYSDLLEACGVDSPAELAQRNAGNLAKAMADYNEKKKIVRTVPSETMITGWITSAKGLTKVVEH